MYIEQVNIRPREARPDAPPATLPRYADYTAGYQGEYTGAADYEPTFTPCELTTQRLLGERTLKLMSLQGVKPVIETTQKITAEVFDARSDNTDWLDVLGAHARTVVMSEALTLAGVTHYLYRIRDNSGIAIASSDYPDGTGKQGFMLFSSGQWKAANGNTMNNQKLRPFLISATPAAIDRSLHRQERRTEAGIAAFGIDGGAFLSGEPPTLPAKDRAANAVMRLYTPAMGIQALVEPLYRDPGAQQFDFAPYVNRQPAFA